MSGRNAAQTTNQRPRLLQSPDFEHAWEAFVAPSIPGCLTAEYPRKGDLLTPFEVRVSAWSSFVGEPRSRTRPRFRFLGRTVRRYWQTVNHLGQWCGKPARRWHAATAEVRSRGAKTREQTP